MPDIREKPSNIREKNSAPKGRTSTKAVRTVGRQLTEKYRKELAQPDKDKHEESTATETADAGEHIYELDQGHNSLWGCLPYLPMCLIGVPHQKQKQPVTGCTKQDFFTVHNV